MTNLHAQEFKQTAKWVERATRILEIAGDEQSNAEEKSKANKELVSLKPSLDDDPRSVFSFVLAAMSEKKWQFSLDQSSEILKRHEDYIPARVANTRILLMMDKKLPAVAELENLAKQLGKSSGDVTLEQREAAASFLGLSIGYFEGPAKELIKPTALNQLVAVAEKIPSDLKESFSIARSTVIEEYQIMVESGEDALKKRRDGMSKEIEEKKADLEAQKKKAEEDTEAKKKRLESDMAAAQVSWNAAWNKSRELYSNLNNLKLQQSQLATNRELIQPPKPDPKGNVDPIQQQRFLEAVRQSDNAIANLNLPINQLATQYDAVIRNGMMIEIKMNSIHNQAQQLGLNLAVQTESFAKAEKVVKGKEKAAKSVEPKLTGNKLRQARAYATYDDFNFHREQQLLIDSFPK